MKKYKFNITDRTVAIYGAGEVKIFDVDNPLFTMARQGCLDDKEEVIDDLFSVAFKKAIEYIGFEVVNDVVMVDGEDIPTYLGKRIKELADEGSSYTYAVNFWHRVKENPSYNAVHELFEFLERHHCPFFNDDSGRFVAYKAVTNEYKDKQTQTIDNKPGQAPEMKRRDVNDNYNEACSTGFHAGSFKYAQEYVSNNDRLVEVLIDPVDVVCIPKDSNWAKMRVCKYKVLTEIDRHATQPTTQVYKGTIAEEKAAAPESKQEKPYRFGDKEDFDEPTATPEAVTGSKWSPQEEYWLKNNYSGATPWPELALKFSLQFPARSADSIRKKVRRMGL